MNDNAKCSCWRCWFQSTLTPLALFTILILSFITTVVLMHEDSILDKYVTWMQGWDTGVLASLGVALQGNQHVSHTDSEQLEPKLDKLEP